MSARPGMAQKSHCGSHVRADISWQESAACGDHDPEMWFDPDRYMDALAVCSTCPVKAPCTQLGKAYRYGVWGGRIHRSKQANDV